MSRPLVVALALVLAVLLCRATVSTAWAEPHASAASPPEGAATVPLKELLPLLASTPGTTAHPPPVDAVIEQVKLTGRLAPDALQVHAHLAVNVLAEDRWTRLELFALGPQAHLTSVTTLENATVAAVDGRITFLTKTSGRYAFNVEWVQRATGPVGARRVELTPGKALGPAPLWFQADESWVTLHPRAASPSGEGYELFPTGGKYTLAWTSGQTVKKVAAAVARPPLEPTIPVAHALFVSTLEGRASLRVRYSLRVDREQPFDVVLPENTRLERVLLNQVPVAPPSQDGKAPMRLMVGPARVGETDGTVELVLAREYGVFHLSGVLPIELPRVSWPLSELRGRAYLPDVFQYEQAGGSVQLDTEKASDAATTAVAAGAGWPTHGSVLPGRLLEFRQYLVTASAPTLSLDYSVDISRSYFH